MTAFATASAFGWEFVSAYWQNILERYGIRDGLVQTTIVAEHDGSFYGAPWRVDYLCFSSRGALDVSCMGLGILSLICIEHAADKGMTLIGLCPRYYHK